MVIDIELRRGNSRFPIFLCGFCFFLSPMEQCEVSLSADGYLPNVLRVLAVDDNIICLKILERLLIQCGYIVTVTQHAHEALKLLRENKDIYDIVITDINMPEMDGFKLLEMIGLEMDLPVIMLSVECDVNSVMKGIMHGAVDYLVKPVRLEELKVIWKHVAKKSLKEMKVPNDPIKKLDHARMAQPFQDSQPFRKHKNHRNGRDGDVYEADDDSDDSGEETTAQKKPRVTWSRKLHTKFIDAVNKLGLDRAVPKKILDIMNIPGLTRENVASHLQKYRRGLKKNGMGLGEHLDPDTNANGYGGSSDFMTINNQCPPISSFKNFHATGYKRLPEPFACFPSQRSHIGYATLLPSWCTHPVSQQNDFGGHCSINTPSNQLVTAQKHTVSPQTSQYIIKNPGLITNSLEMSAPTQASFDDFSYMSFSPRSNQLTYSTPTSQIHLPHRNAALSSGCPIECPDGRNAGIFFNSSTLKRDDLDDSSSVELNPMLPSEQKQQQFICSGIDVEIGVLINNGFVDVQSNAIEDHQISLIDLPNFAAEVSSPEIASLNAVDNEDDLHAALKQFMP